MHEVKIGIIGGTGIYNLDNMKLIDEVSIDTPYGSPSDKYIIGELNGIKVAFLSRHGRGHRISPSELNSRANIYGFKELGVKYLIGVSAVGSLRDEIEPSHLVFPDQIIDRTKGRPSTFFGNGVVAHAAFAEPFCKKLTDKLVESSEALGIKYHKDKTYVCMEGPLFSTKAESNFHRMIGGDVIGMTAIPEAKLAREAEICYAMIVLSTDYDCWKEGEEAVTVDMVIQTMNKNIHTAKKLLSDLIPKIGNDECGCHTSMEYAIMTHKEHWPKDAKEKMGLIIERFL